MSVRSSLSGFPEWLPEDRWIEQAFIESIRRKFELFGFTPLETRAVEPLSALLAKGETDKEIYILRRLQAAPDEADKGLGLHFDLTVPLARYLLENRSLLSFPLRRYQIQKAWRGERPGLGRYREFLQADIDIIDEKPLTIHSDLEVLQAIQEIVVTLPIPEVRLFVNNRKLVEGFCRSLGIKPIAETLRVLDKLEKIGEEQIHQTLTNSVGLAPQAATACIQFGKIKGADWDTIYRNIKAFGLADPLLEEGLDELGTILKACNRQPKSLVWADLSIIRGLDYYTGTVCEGKFVQFPSYPAICAGGRYDNLASTGKVKLPGVGISIGITRILGLILDANILRASRKTPACVLVALVADELRDQSFEIAHLLRNRDISCEVFPRPIRYGKQIAYAEAKGIPYVWFPPETGAGPGEVRDIRNRSQVKADPASWLPPIEDRDIQIIYDNEALQQLIQRFQMH